MTVGLIDCINNSIDPKQIQNFCNDVKLGYNFEDLTLSLSSKSLELRTRAPEADQKISSQLINPYTVDGALITSKNLSYSKLVPACMIYFSSPYLGGDNKIIYKQFITQVPKGI